MNSFLRSITHGISFGIILFLTIAGFTYAISMNFPTVSPPGTGIVSDGSFFTDYFSKILVNPDPDTTNGVVKVSKTTQQIATITNNTLASWNSSKLIDATGVSNSVNGKIEVSNGIKIGNPSPNQILVNVGGGNMVWKNQSDVLRRCRTPLPSSLNLAHLTPYVGSPDSWNQDYIKDAPSCGYTCKPDWIGADCNTPKPINGVCGSSDGTCASGTPSGYYGGSCGGYPTWSCIGKNNGSSSSCQGGYNGDCPPVQSCGTFAGICGGNGAIDTYWCCGGGNPGGWVDVGYGCYHQCM